MFYFLIFLGIGLVGIGLLHKDGEIVEKELPLDYKNLENRISDIEKLIFDDFLDHETVVNGLDKAEEEISKYELIRRYEGENKSIEEICSLLNMQKGEVYLLKNIYKDL